MQKWPEFISIATARFATESAVRLSDRGSLSGQVEAELGGSGFFDVIVYHKTSPH